MIKKYDKIVRVQDVRIDHRYQRGLSRQRVNNIKKNYDHDSIGIISVSLRKDGFYYILDGQHRFVAMKELGFESVLCLVHEDLEYEDEAKLFRNFNTVKQPRINDVNRARLQFGDEVMLDIVRILESCGLSLNFASNDNNGIVAHSAIEKIYAKHGAEQLEKLLKTIIECFGQSKEGFQGRILIGMNDFLVKYKDKIKDDQFIKRMKKEGLNNVMIKAKEFSKVQGGVFNKNFTSALIHYYNKNRREQDQIGVA